MTQRRSRRAAAAVALAAVLALATPAHAAGRHAWTAGSGWIEQAVQWIAGLWTGNATETRNTDSRTGAKTGLGTQPGNPPNAMAPPTVDPTSERGSGIDPNG